MAVDYSIAFLSNVDLARSYIQLAFRLGVLALIASRWVWQQWLATKRSHVAYSARVPLVGPFDGAVVPGHRATHHLHGAGIPLSRDFDAVFQTMDAAGSETVIVTSCDDLAVRLHGLGAAVPATDPEVILHSRRAHPQLSFTESLGETLKGVELVVLATGWNESHLLLPTDVEPFTCSRAVIDGRNTPDSVIQYLCHGKSESRG